MGNPCLDKVDTVVLGGGISGLYLALLLGRVGHRVVVLEKNTTVGGLLQTVQHEGFHFDLGGHRLVFADPGDLFLFLQEIGLSEPMIEHHRRARIIVEKKFLHYPPGLIDALRFPSRLWVPAVWDLLIGSRRFSSPSTFEEWLCHHYGETIYNLIFKDYTRKVWGVECSSFSPQFLEQRVGRFHWREFFLGRPGIKSKDTRRFFHYPSLGMAEITGAVMAGLGKNVSVLRSSQAVELRPEGIGARVCFSSEHAGAGEILARNVVSTIPVPALFQTLADHDLEQYLPAYKSRHLVLLNLILEDNCRLPQLHWVYFPQGDIVFSRAFIPRTWSVKMTPSLGCSVSFEVICGDDLAHLSDKDLLDSLLKDIDKTGMNFTLKDVRHAFLTRYEHAYPVVIDREMIEQGKRAAVTRFPFLKFAGRAGTHAYYDIEDCVNSVRSVVNDLKRFPEN